MRLARYLNESFAKTVTIKDFCEIVAVKCSTNFAAMWKSDNWLNRGDKNLSATVPSYLSAAFRGERRSSRDLGNEYNKLLSDYIPSWNEYPKRNKAVICQTGIPKQAAFGPGFIIIPFDNTNLAVAPKNDLWTSFNTSKTIGISSLQHFGKFAREILKLDINSVGSTQQVLNSTLGTIIKGRLAQIKNEVLEFYEYAKKYPNKTVLEWLDAVVFDPKKNKFTIITSCEYLPKKSQEIWFDGDGFAVKSIPTKADIKINSIDWLASEHKEFFKLYKKLKLI